MKSSTPPLPLFFLTLLLSTLLLILFTEDISARFCPICVHGWCNKKTGVCECHSGWNGNSCNKPLCEMSCNHGTCTFPNQCSCQSGWKQPYCKEFYCSAHCNFRGNCTGANFCECEYGYEGNECQYAKCDQCMNGICSKPFECDCNRGWNGSRCDIPICDENCNGRGDCVGPNSCKCVEGWTGDQCLLNIMDQLVVIGNLTEFQFVDSNSNEVSLKIESGKFYEGASLKLSEYTSTTGHEFENSEIFQVGRYSLFVSEIPSGLTFNISLRIGQLESGNNPYSIQVLDLSQKGTRVSSIVKNCLDFSIDFQLMNFNSNIVDFELYGQLQDVKIQLSESILNIGYPLQAHLKSDNDLFPNMTIDLLFNQPGICLQSLKITQDIAPPGFFEQDYLFLSWFGLEYSNEMEVTYHIDNLITDIFSAGDDKQVNIYADSFKCIYQRNSLMELYEGTLDASKMKCLVKPTFEFIGIVAKQFLPTVDNLNFLPDHFVFYIRPTNPVYDFTLDIDMEQNSAIQVKTDSDELLVEIHFEDQANQTQLQNGTNIIEIKEEWNKNQIKLSFKGKHPLSTKVNFELLRIPTSHDWVYVAVFVPLSIAAVLLVILIVLAILYKKKKMKQPNRENDYLINNTYDQITY